MPNWVWNKVTFRGTRSEVAAYRDLVGSDRGEFDFDAVVPMPAALNLCSDPDATAYALKYGDWKAEPWWGSQFDTREAVLQAARHPENADRWGRLVLDSIGATPRVIPRAFDEAADMAYANVLAHGHPHWYDWRCEHWGTKWNAGSVEWSTADGVESVCFDTAWAPPVPVVERLAQRFPDAEIVLEYDSMESHFRGRVAFAGGVVVEESHEDYDPYAEAGIEL